MKYAGGVPLRVSGPRGEGVSKKQEMLSKCTAVVLCSYPVLMPAPNVTIWSEEILPSHPNCWAGILEAFGASQGHQKQWLEQGVQPARQCAPGWQISSFPHRLPGEGTHSNQFTLPGNQPWSEAQLHTLPEGASCTPGTQRKPSWGGLGCLGAQHPEIHLPTADCPARLWAFGQPQSLDSEILRKESS